jgi:hypothetical protein
MKSNTKTHGVFYQKGNAGSWYMMSLKEFMKINNKNYELVMVFSGSLAECLFEQAFLECINE